MSRGRTLWEMLVDRIRGPVELRYYNPLRAKVGGSVMVDDIDLKDLHFFIKEIRAYRRTVGGRQFFSTDYVLLARPLEAANVWLRLRLNPVEDPDAAGGMTYHVLLLRLDDEFGYDEAFHKVVSDPSGKF